MAFLLVFEILAWQGLSLVFQAGPMELSVCHEIAAEMRKAAEKELPGKKYHIVCDKKERI